MRLCANTGARLHLVRPLGFTLTDRRLTRAGLDYRDRAGLSVHDSWPDLCARLPPTRMYLVDTIGNTTLGSCRFRSGDVLVFGSEPSGIPETVLRTVPRERVVRIPMVAHNRSLNLSNAVAVTLYEAWRQVGYAGAD